MMAGLIRDEERRSMAGIPGLSDIPVIGRLFAYNHKETTETDIILTLTPRIVRVLDLNANDLEAFRVGRDSGSTVVDLPPLPIPLPQQQPPKPPPGDAEAVPPVQSRPPAVPPPAGSATPIVPPPVKPPPPRGGKI
jgi:general secretion pathway protein D